MENTREKYWTDMSCVSKKDIIRVTIITIVFYIFGDAFLGIFLYHVIVDYNPGTFIFIFVPAASVFMILLHCWVIWHLRHEWQQWKKQHGVV
ncbi:MAG: hypothetical protein PHC97_02075 [Patescibacteria group bacterium]|nr:hypothetical protein [Patescibacteria group bacterium]